MTGASQVTTIEPSTRSYDGMIVSVRVGGALSVAVGGLVAVAVIVTVGVSPSTDVAVAVGVGKPVGRAWLLPLAAWWVIRTVAPPTAMWTRFSSPS